MSGEYLPAKKNAPESCDFDMITKVLADSSMWSYVDERKLMRADELKSATDLVLGTFGLFRTLGLTRTATILYHRNQIESLQTEIMKRRALLTYEVTKRRLEIMQECFKIYEWLANSYDRRLNAKLELYAERAEIIRRLHGESGQRAFVGKLDAAICKASIELFEVQQDPRIAGGDKLTKQEAIIQAFEREVNGTSQTIKPTVTASAVDRMKQRDAQTKEVDAWYLEQLAEVDAASVSDLEKIKTKRELAVEREQKIKNIYNG